MVYGGGYSTVEAIRVLIAVWQKPCRDASKAIQMSEEEYTSAADRRRKVNTDYRERCRKRKFIAKYGLEAFYTHYLPLHNMLGPHLPRQKFVLEEVEGRHHRKGNAKASRTS
ncbi:hypothetical protein C8R43DRAFT_956261 [Mycena crocata]|nr:hypothetical protein C8R43DRAFT_956261 [Mycena crocata]